MAEGCSQNNNDVCNFLQGNLREQCDEVLVLKSIYDGTGVNSIKELSCPGKDEALFILSIFIPIDTREEWMTLDVEIKDDEYQDVKDEPPDIGKDFQLIRSEDSWTGSLQVKFLPPLNLQVTLPKTYPSHDAPDCTMSCPWLTSEQLSSLHNQLGDLWTESQGMPILFTWIDWLQSNTLSHLNVGSHVKVETGKEILITNIREAITVILEYNNEQETLDFSKSSHLCPICFDEIVGSKCIRLDECKHYLCVDCMTNYCQHHVSGGSVEELRCTENGCHTVIPPHILHSVLSQDDFLRWERLMLQKTLERMEDIEWCPRCNSAVILEVNDEQHFGHCTTCVYSYCTLCRDAWHQGEPCVSMTEKLNKVQNEKDRKSSAADRRRFEELRRKLEEEVNSYLSLHKQTKKCPRCKAKIEKIGGCNKMTCRCGAKFCWLCEKVIQSYGHFMGGRSSCQLMDITTVADLRTREDGLAHITERNIDEVRDFLQPIQMSQISPCPRCRYRNSRQDRNNHIKCSSCKINYCFSCREVIQGVVTTHFNRGSCQQHS